MVIINTDGQFLNADEVSAGEYITILNSGQKTKSTMWKDKDGEFRDELKFSVQIQNGTEKILTMNKTSQKRLAESWGKDTEGWVGKVCIIGFGITPNGKKMFLLEPKSAA